MEQLAHFSPARRSLPFHLVGKSHIDEFLENHFDNLLLEINALATMAFCPKNECTPPRFSPWRQKYSSQFRKYVELVARPDPSRHEWEMLLRNKEERKCLLHAIITKIIEVEVFSGVLIGADSKHQQLLESADASLARTEWFRRSSIRAQTNCAYLETRSGQPPLFWDEVDRLCAQTLTLLMPLYEWTSEVAEWQPSPITEVYQCLHDVISYACWLSIYIQASPGIIEYSWAAPGESYHLDQVNAHHDLYEVSKLSVERERAIYRVASGSPMMAARVKISMVPKIVRYIPATDALGTEGIETYTIIQPHVVYYHGRHLDQDENKVYVSLSEYIHKLNQCAGKGKSVSAGSPFLVLVGMLLFVWMTFTHFDHIRPYIKEYITDVGVELLWAFGRTIQERF